MNIDVAAIKQGQRAMWASGDYPQVARRIEGVAELLADRAGAQSGIRMLDVATGSGNVALAGARAGAEVTGLDLTPELLEAARGRAADAGLDVRFVEGDAEELPFETDSFDVVTSCFGVMFAPRHEQAAAELARVARPGGTVAVTAWTPDGLVGRTFEIVSSFMPPPPGLHAPVSWGTEEHVRELFAASGADVSFERRTVTFSHESAEGWLDYDERILGPAIMTKAALEPQGRYGELREAMLDLYRGANEAEDGTFSIQAEYLLSVARLPG
ncbi:MAG TPA: methyltransferase domain-containing protein [Solirubrobacteraceae bacterium]|jgi:SAM-dependent methyltransferase|nr:methyltransferase domain-containing protein [Solirubrobacteraceae bacterium]